MSQKTSFSYRIARRTGYQGARCPVIDQAGNEKLATGNKYISVEHVVNLRSDLRSGTWNVRKIKQAIKLGTICRELDRKNIQILGISETNWNDSGSCTTIDSNLVIYSGKSSGYSQGVAVILAKEIKDALIRYTPVSDRIIKLRLQGRPQNLSIIQYFAPTSVASEEDIDGFYDRLQETLESIPNRDIKIVMGDTNAIVNKSLHSCETHGMHGLGERNIRGDAYVEFCKANNLAIANTFFTHHPRHLYTWISPDGKTRNQYDHIAISLKWRSSVKDTRTLPGADCNTDHQLRISQIKVPLKKLNQGPTPLRLDLTSIDNRYRIQISNKFEALLRCKETKTPNELWEEGKRNIQNVAKRTIAKKKKTQNQWIPNETLLEVEKRRTIKARGLNTDEERKIYREYKSNIQKMIKQDKVKYISKQCEAMEQN